MILIIGRFNINPENRTAFLSFADQVIEYERNTAGCDRFEIYEDVTVPNQFIMLEEWADRDALERHFETPEYDEHDEKLMSFVVDEPSWDEYEF